MYVNVILPVYLPQRLTYFVPECMRVGVSIGTRVLVPLKGSKIYAAVVSNILEDYLPSGDFEIKNIIQIIGNEPITSSSQLKLWQWIASYYMCSEGEVMRYFMPSGLKIEAFITPEKIQYKSNKTIKNVRMLRLSDAFSSQENRELLTLALDKMQRKAKKQYAVMMMFLSYATDDLKDYSIEEDRIKQDSGIGSIVINELVKKEILERFTVEKIVDLNKDKLISDISHRRDAELTDDDIFSLKSLREAFSEKKTILYHTSYTRIEVIVDLINETYNAGGSVMVLMPEIGKGLSSELKRVFGEDLIFNTSRLTPTQKYDVYCKTLVAERAVIVGSASSIGLPVQNLKRIIVLDEHSSIYKYSYNNPRFNARDCAVVLAQISGAELILESHTPSVESFYNASIGKYTLVRDADFQKIKVKEIEKFSIATKERILYGAQRQVRYFSKYLLNQVSRVVERNQNVLLFHPRRGYSSYMECGECGEVVKCKHCNVSLTYHKQKNIMLCHYCDYNEPMTKSCSHCGSKDMRLRGVGSENVEESVKEFFPLTSTIRIDSDTFGRNISATSTMKRLTQESPLIIVGTQLSSVVATRANIGVVGIVDADKLFNIPDYKAEERAFQTIVGLSLKCKGADMVLQCANPRSDIAKDIVNQDFDNFYRREIDVRRQFNYPPFCRHIKVTIKSAEQIKANAVADDIANVLRSRMNIPVVGAYAPNIDKINNAYIFHVLLKLPRSSQIAELKGIVRETVNSDRYKNVSITIDVDPITI